jgi:hypothetical protein
LRISGNLGWYLLIAIIVIVAWPILILGIIVDAFTKVYNGHVKRVYYGLSDDTKDVIIWTGKVIKVGLGILVLVCIVTWLITPNSSSRYGDIPNDEPCWGPRC